MHSVAYRLAIICHVVSVVFRLLTQMRLTGCEILIPRPLHDRSSRRVARVVVVARCSFCVRCPVTGFEPTARAPAHSVCPSDQSDLSAHGPCAMHCPCPRLVSSLRTATRLHTTTRASCVAPHMTLHVPKRALPLSSTMHVPNSSPAPASGKASQDCGVPVHPAAVQLQPSVLLGGGGGDGAQGA